MKILFVAANPSESSPLRLGEELREIEAKLGRSDKREDLQLNSAFAARPDDLLQLMNKYRPHILHFSGHGTKTGEIVLEAHDGKPRPILPTALKALFEVFRPELQVVVLNACHSAIQATAFLDVIDVVIGIGSSTSDEASIVFAAAFYQALGFGRSVADAFKQGTAAMLLQGMAADNKPVLLHRASSNPSALTLATSLPLQRANDPNVPERLRTLLADGCKLFVLTDSNTAAGTPVYFELALRYSNKRYVVEASIQETIRATASTLAACLMPPVAARQYEWTLVRRRHGEDYKEGVAGVDESLAPHLTLEMAGVESGNVVLLVGNHLLPEWAPKMGPV